MIQITQKVFGVSKFTVWLFPIACLIVFIIGNLPILGSFFIVTILKKALAVYIGIIFPGYETFKTIEKRKNTDPYKMLSYWLVAALSYLIFYLLGLVLPSNFLEFLFYCSLIGLTMLNYFVSHIVYRVIVRSLINRIRYAYGSTKPEKATEEKSS